jgi:AbrB family looped-hinge helix DNA binding protein
MRITQKGQVTIPETIREKYGLLPYANVEFIEDNGKVYIAVTNKKKHRGHSIVTHLRGSGSVRMTTDEILALTRGKK